MLGVYYACRSDDLTQFEFVINAYPKNLTLRAKSQAELDDWLQALMLPLTTQGIPYHGGSVAGGLEQAAAAAAAAGGGGGGGVAASDSS